MLSDTEKQELKGILINIFGERARQWEVNEDSVKILSEMLAKGRKCSGAIDKLPKVPGWMPGAAYIPKQIISYLFQEVKHNPHSIYQMCQAVQLSPYANAFEMASLGLPVYHPVCY
jgi:hypothetical protein